MLSFLREDLLMRTLLLCVVLVAGLVAQENPQRATWRTGVAAVVNGQIITEAEVWNAVRGATAGLSPERKKEIFDGKLLGMIREMVLDQSVKRLQLSINPAAVRSWVEQRKEELGSVDAFNESLRERDQTEAQFIAEMAQNQSRMVLVRAQAGAMRGMGGALRAAHVVDPTMDEVREYYKSHLETEFKKGAEAHVHAMAFTRSAFGSDEKAAEVAAQVRKELAEGADFATLAKRHSNLEPEKGGDLGWITKEAEWGPEILDYAFAAKVGELSAPIAWRRGWLLIKVEDRREAGVVSFGEAQAAIRAKLREARVSRATAAVEKKAIEEAWIQPAEAKQLLIQWSESESRTRR